MAPATTTPLRTVAVLGASYGGAHAAQVIAAGLPDGWRVVLIDRNSHVNHVYVLPRLAILPGHEHKAFVPTTNIFNLADRTDPTRHIFLHAHILALHSHSLTLSCAFPEHGIGADGVLGFEYAVYALGSRMPAPLDLWGEHGPHQAQDGLVQSPEGVKDGEKDEKFGGTKSEGIAWLKRAQARIAAARSVLVVGGGALGIQFATDIAALHPGARVTLLHSRARLLPRFDERLHGEVLHALESLGVMPILGERLAPALPGDKPGVYRTSKGREIEAELVLRCTGQTPNTALLRALDVHLVEEESGQARALRTMQVAVASPLRPCQEEVVSEPMRRVETRREEGAREEASKREEMKGGEGGQPTLEDVLATLTLSDSSSPSALLSASSASPTVPEHDVDLEPGAEEEDIHTPYPHLFAIGDAAAAFGAVPAGHNAYWQAGVAGRNVLRLIRRDERRARAPRDGAAQMGGEDGTARGGEDGGEEKDEDLEQYMPGPPAIKVSLGLTKNAYEVSGSVGVGREERADLSACAIWPYFGCAVADPDAEVGEIYS
ncbi:FAD/NAD-P-binding domain-containing protein [Mycena latifolia]|nr:FAD/NAD-P-binding domain-containing protein [Mycena latifolia]